jgi:hypothetical protein
MPRTTTLGAEVTNVSGHCFWILLDDEELALPYSEFPWFKAATIQQILNVLRPTANHLFWPDLDIDLSVESIRHPERFPLLAKSTFHPAPLVDRPPSTPYCATSSFVPATQGQRYVPSRSWVFASK